MNIGSESGLKLKDITPITATSTSLRRKIQIQLLDNMGKTETTYRWEGTSGKTLIPSSSTEDVGETEIPAGQGLWVLNTANVATKFQSCGQVGADDIIQPLDASGGFVMTGNWFPVSIKLKDIVPSTETSTSLRRKIQIQLLDNMGKTATTYRWEGTSGKTWIPSSSTEDIGETTIPAGQAIWVLNTANCAATMRIAAPEL